MSRRFLTTAVLLFIGSQMLFLANINFPSSYNFDEVQYIPAAKRFLGHGAPQNIEHPPLAKFIMAIGIGVFGDQPMGWRVMSTLFGSLTLVGIFVLAWVLFRVESLALWVALVTLANQLLYVQARIAMLDTFMCGFLVWGLALFCATWDERLGQRRILGLFAGSGVFFGLSIACKWFALAPWLACWVLVSGVFIMQHWGAQFRNPQASDWYRPNLWANISKTRVGLSFGIVPLFVYWLAFLPFYFLPDTDMSVLGFVKMQIRTWSEQQSVGGPHPYMSSWTGWAFLKRPIWYAFEQEGTHPIWIKGILLLGNPLIMWTGILAVGICTFDWIKTRDRASFLVTYLYLSLYLCWALIPRAVSFYYYYYPAGMILGLALSRMFQLVEGSTKVPRWIFLVLAFALFVYFLPILSGSRIPLKSLYRYLWFASWV